MIEAVADRFPAQIFRALVAFLLCVAMLGTFASPAAAQKDKKKKKDDAAPANIQPIIPMGDEQQIDYIISSMLGAWPLRPLHPLPQTYPHDLLFSTHLPTPPN